MRSRGLWLVGGGGRGEGAWVIFHGPPFHQSRSPLLLARLEHVNSIQQLYKQSRSEAASQIRVDETYWSHWFIVMTFIYYFLLCGLGILVGVDLK